MENLLNQEWLFPANAKEAVKIQRKLSSLVSIQDESIPNPKWIAGMDVSNNMFDPLQMIYASNVILSYPLLQVTETASYSQKQNFPYITGLLGFREAPALVSAFQKLTIKPDIVLVDGQGISHPRRLGIASHIGVLLSIPTIGVAKSILIGEPDGELGQAPGSLVSLVWKGNKIGVLLRTKKGCNPLVISSGHKISIHRAVDIVMGCLNGYRLPEPIRQAHIAANQYRLSLSKAYKRKVRA